MARSGRYSVKNPEKYNGDPTNVVYRSGWEMYCMRYFDESADVKSWSSEEVVIPYLYEVDNKYHRYFMDFKVVYTNGKTVLIEVKPHKECSPPTSGKRTKKYITEAYTYVKNQNKWNATKKYVEDRGWHFEICTEKNGSPLAGLIPKSVKPAKPLKKLKPFSRKKTK